MEDLGRLRKELIQYCEEEITRKREVLEKNIGDAQKSANDETKSTVGDKHETAKAMAHLEQEKNAKQLRVVKELERGLMELKKVNPSGTVQFGALVETSMGFFFLSLGLGKVEISGTVVFLSSPISPIGKIMRGKKEGDELIFNGNPLLIKRIL